MFTECRPHFIVLQKYLRRYLSPLHQRSIVLLDALDSLATINNAAYCIPEGNQIDALRQNLSDLAMNIRFVGLRADIVTILMASQVCLWEVISIAWQVLEMCLRYLNMKDLIGRKVHNEMSWMNSVEMTEMIRTKQDYMSNMYDNALRIAQVCGSSILRFIDSIHTDLFTTFVTDIIPEMKGVYEGLQQKWLSVSEEDDLKQEFDRLVKQTGFKM